MTVDHVLPQTPEGVWLDEFRTQDIEKWTDTWANLVPLSSKANSEKGQKSWAETREARPPGAEDALAIGESGAVS